MPTMAKDLSGDDNEVATLREVLSQVNDLVAQRPDLLDQPIMLEWGEYGFVSTSGATLTEGKVTLGVLDI